METPRTPETRTDPPADRLAEPQHPAHADAPVVHDTAVPESERIERTVSTRTGETRPPVVRTVVTESERIERPVVEVRDARVPGRLLWWIGGGTLAAGSLAALVRVLRERLATPEPTPLERLADAGRGAGLPLALSLAGTAAGVGASLRARRRRRTEEVLAAPAVPFLLGEAVSAEAGEDDVDGLPPVNEASDAYPAGALETEALPLEVVVLLDTLLDPSLDEGRELPGAAALRAQLPHVRTVASVAEEIREDGKVPDWTPLVVEEETGVARAIPNDMVWPVRGRFTTEDGHELELRLQVIDGELGALVITLPEDVEDGVAAWDAFQELEAFPGVEELTFTVDGDRRP